MRGVYIKTKLQLTTQIFARQEQAVRSFHWRYSISYLIRSGEIPSYENLLRV